MARPHSGDDDPTNIPKRLFLVSIVLVEEERGVAVDIASRRVGISIAYGVGLEVAHDGAEGEVRGILIVSAEDQGPGTLGQLARSLEIRANIGAGECV